MELKEIGRQARRITPHNIHWRLKWSWLFIKYGQVPRFFGKRPFWYRCALGWFSLPDFWAPAVLAPDYEPALDKLVGNLRNGLFVDVGANVGRYTVMAARNGNRVIAIEASPETASCLRATIERNKLGHLVQLIEAAASEYNGLANFDIATDSSVSHLVGGRRDDSKILVKSTVPVHTISLDSLLAREQRPSLIKIDVEGMDAKVLRGARGLVKAGVPITFEALNMDYYQECQKELQGRPAEYIDDRNCYVP